MIAENMRERQRERAVCLRVRVRVCVCVRESAWQAIAKNTRPFLRDGLKLLVYEAF